MKAKIHDVELVHIEHVNMAEWSGSVIVWYGRCHTHKIDVYTDEPPGLPNTVGGVIRTVDLVIYGDKYCVVEGRNVKYAWPENRINYWSWRLDEVRTHKDRDVYSVTVSTYYQGEQFESCKYVYWIVARRSHVIGLYRIRRKLICWLLNSESGVVVRSCEDIHIALIRKWKDMVYRVGTSEAAARLVARDLCRVCGCEVLAEASWDDIRKEIARIFE